MHPCNQNILLTASIFSKVSYLCKQLDESFDEWVFFSQIQCIIITAIITATCLLLLPRERYNDESNKNNKIVTNKIRKSMTWKEDKKNTFR